MDIKFGSVNSLEDFKNVVKNLSEGLEQGLVAKKLSDDSIVLKKANLFDRIWSFIKWKPSSKKAETINAIVDRFLEKNQRFVLEDIDDLSLKKIVPFMGENKINTLVEKCLLGDTRKPEVVKVAEKFVSGADRAKRETPLYHFAEAIVKSREGDLVDRFSSIMRAAEKGYAPAEYLAAKAYQKGEGIEKDKEAAFELFLKAAKQGHRGAQYELGRIYEEGRGVDADVAESLKWFEKSALQGEVWAQYALARAYENGHGIARNPEMAAYWDHLATEGRYPPSLYKIGQVHMQQGDDPLAMHCFLEAAEEGYAPAQLAFAQGLERKQEFELAVYWYEQAAERGEEVAEAVLPEVWFKLGQAYETGSEELGVPKRPENSLTFYHQAAQRGYQPAIEAEQRLDSRRG